MLKSAIMCKEQVHVHYVINKLLQLKSAMKDYGTQLQWKST